MRDNEGAHETARGEGGSAQVDLAHGALERSKHRVKNLDAR